MNDAEFNEKLRNPNNAKKSDLFFALLLIALVIILWEIFIPLGILAFILVIEVWLRGADESTHL